MSCMSGMYALLLVTLSLIVDIITPLLGLIRVPSPLQPGTLFQHPNRQHHGLSMVILACPCCKTTPYRALYLLAS